MKYLAMFFLIFANDSHQVSPKREKLLQGILKSEMPLELA
jgi:hypothetical protein